jgi:hypothetical protein
MAGLNFDDGYSPNEGGTFNGTHVTIEFNGCNQEYPWVSEFGALSCYDQGSGGYGDGVGTPTVSAMNFYCDQCNSIFNTQVNSLPPSFFSLFFPALLSLISISFTGCI